MKNKNLVFWALIAGAAILYVKDSPQLVDQLKGLLASSASIEAAELPEPLNYRGDAEAVRTALAGHPEMAHSCCQLWWGIADTLFADDKLITTTKQVRDANQMAGKLTFAGRTPPSSAVVDAANAGLVELFGGTPNRELTGDERAQLVNYFRAIAWGASQAQ